jgi:hypothetical protein
VWNSRLSQILQSHQDHIGRVSEAAKQAAAQDKEGTSLAKRKEWLASGAHDDTSEQFDFTLALEHLESS